MRLGYARCSTDEQADALAAQVARLEAAGCERVVSELQSGRDDDRAGLAEVLALIRGGGVKELAITRADRLGRHAAFADELLALCALHGVAVLALDGGTIEAASPAGFLQARLLTTMAEVESRMLSQRLTKQFEVYRAQGRHLRRRKPFGYQGGANHKLEPHPEQWPEALRVIEELRRVGSFSKVSQLLPSWCSWTPAASSLQAWFVNPVIRGHIGHKLERKGAKGWNAQWGEMHFDQHQALIGEAEWQELAQHLRRPSNRFVGSNNEIRHGMTGLLVCASCGFKLRRNSAQGTTWWRCRHRLCQDRGAIKEQAALPLVVAACVDAADRLAAAAAMPPDENPAVAAKRRDLEQLEGLARRNPALGLAVDALRNEVESLSRKPVVSPDLAVYQQMLSDPEIFNVAEPEQQRAVFGAVLQSVAVTREGQAHAVLRSW